MDGERLLVLLSFYRFLVNEVRWVAVWRVNS